MGNPNAAASNAITVKKCPYCDIWPKSVRYNRKYMIVCKECHTNTRGHKLWREAVIEWNGDIQRGE